MSYLYSKSCRVGHHTTDLSTPVQSVLWGWSPHHRPVNIWLCLTCTVRAVGLVTTPQTCQHLTMSYLYSQSCGVGYHTTDLSTSVSYLYSRSCDTGDHFNTWLCLTCTVRSVGLVTTPQTCQHLTVSYLYSQSCGVCHHVTNLSACDCVLPVQSELWGWLPHHRPVNTWQCLTCTVRAVRVVIVWTFDCLTCTVTAVKVVIVSVPNCLTCTVRAVRVVTVSIPMCYLYRAVRLVIVSTVDL